MTLLREGLIALVKETLNRHAGMYAENVDATAIGIPLFGVEIEYPDIGTHRDEDELDGFQNRIRLTFIPRNAEAIAVGNLVDDSSEGPIHCMITPRQLGG